MAFTEYTLTSGRLPLACCLGADGNVWYISNGGASRVCKITSGGTVTEYACPDSAADLQDICAGPDGNLWVIGYTSNKVYKVTTGGSFTSYSSGITAAAGLYQICSGPDGNLWFTESVTTKVGKITTSGTVTEYSSGITASSQPLAIGSDGTNLWFTEYHTTNGNRVCKITTSGTVTEYAISTGSFRPSCVVKAPDGNMWVGSFNTDKVLKVDPATGTRTEYTVTTGTAKPCMLTVVGSDLWALCYGTQSLIRINTDGTTVGPAHAIPTASAGAQGHICTGQDGASVWVCEYSVDKIGAYALPVATVPLAIPVWGRNTKTQSLAIAVGAQTQVQKWSGGRFYTNDCTSNTYIDTTKRITKNTALLDASASGGVISLVDNAANFDGYYLNGPGASNNGQTNLTVGSDFAICADVGSYGGSGDNGAGTIMLQQDSNSAYRLDVAKTAGGTSTLYKKSSGSWSSVATVAKGVAASAMARVKIGRDGSSVLNITVDGVSTTYSDPSPHAGPFTVLLGAPGSSSLNKVDNIEVTYGSKIRVLNVPTGGGVVLYDSGGSQVATAAESSGVATLDLTGTVWPYTGSILVCSSLSPVTALADGRFPYQGTTTLYGGDDFYYQPTGMTALTANAEATYATTQSGSHNGVVIHGTVTYGVTLGFNGKVIAFSYDEATGAYAENEIGTQSDMHSTCDLQADSSGILHFVYGGSTIGEQTTKYRKSNTAWSITDLATESDLGEKIHGSMLVDASDNLYLIGSRSNVSSYDQMVSKKRTAAGSWQSTVVIANADASWAIYPCDFALGRDGKLHGMWMAWSAGTGFEHAFHAKSTDGSTWTGITGTSLTLPLSQNSSTGKLSNAATLAADGDYGVSRLTVDSDGTVHAVIGRNTSTYAYFQGSSSTGWPASATYSFTGTVYSNHGAIERFGSYLVYLTMTPVSGPSSSLYSNITRWISSDGGTTWVSTTMLSQPSGTRDRWWWPKLTPVAGQTYTKSLWNGRGTVYGNKDGQSPLSGYGQGVLYLTNISVVLSTTQSLAIPVWARNTKTQSLALPVWGRITKTQDLAIAVTSGVSTNTKTQTFAIATWIPTASISMAIAVGATGLTKTQSLAIAVTGPDAPETTPTNEAVFILKHGYLQRTGMRRST